MLPSLKVKIGADTKGLKDGLSEAENRLQKFRATIARVTVGMSIAIGGALALATKSAFNTVDAQAKLAQSLGTTVESMQVLARAGELAGVQMTGIEQATKDLTRRLSQAASGTGPAVAALKALNLQAADLLKMPLDQRVRAINDAIEEFVPAAQRAAVAGLLFGEEGSIAMSRINSATLDEAIKDIEDFGVAVSEVDADQIERTNDALSRLKLIMTGLGNRIAAQIAPSLEAFANAMANITKQGSPFSNALTAIIENLATIGRVSVALAGFFAGQWVAGIVSAMIAVKNFTAVVTVARAAVVALGGPIGLLWGLVGGAAASWLVFRDNTKEADTAMIDAEFTAKLMNDQLKLFYETGAPSAGSAAIAAANDMKQYASDTLAAAEAHMVLLEAELAASKALQEQATVGGVPQFIMGDVVDRETQNEIDQMGVLITGLRDKFNQASANAKRVASTITGSDFKGAISIVSELDDAADDVDNTLKRVGATIPEVVLPEIEAMNERMKELGSTIEASLTRGFMSIIDGTKTAKDAFRDMAKAIIAKLFEVLVVQKLVGSWEKGTGLAGMMMRALTPTFDGGGFTGAGARSGGVDGRGGFPAILHPNETVVDHTRSGQSAGSSITVIQNNTFGNGVNRSEIQGMLRQNVEITKAAVFDAQRRSVNGLGYA